jgi:hypothetical protein
MDVRTAETSTIDTLANTESFKTYVQLTGKPAALLAAYLPSCFSWCLGGFFQPPIIVPFVNP